MGRWDNTPLRMPHAGYLAAGTATPDGSPTCAAGWSPGNPYYQIALTPATARWGFQSAQTLGFGVVEDSVPFILFRTLTPAASPLPGSTRRWGLPNSPLRMPRAVRVIHGCGWYGPESYPMVYQAGSDFAASYDPPLTPPVLEPTVDYFADLHAQLISALDPHHIEVYAACGWTDYQTSSSSPITAPDPADPQQPGLPGRWLYGLGNCGIPVSLPGGFLPAAQFVGGEVYNVVIATDGFPTYHGFANAIGTYTPTGACAAAFAADKAELRACAARYRKFGVLIVQSPKTVKWFPRWVTPSTGLVNHGREAMYPEAHDCIAGIASDLADVGVEALQRSFTIGTDGLCADTGSQVPVSEIVTRARAFFGV